MRKKIIIVFILVLVHLVYLKIYFIYPVSFEYKTTRVSTYYDDYVLDYNYFNKLILTHNRKKLSYTGILVFQKVTINKKSDSCFEINTKSLGFIDTKKRVFIKYLKNNEIEYYYTE